jgi:hypothetical protein
MNNKVNLSRLQVSCWALCSSKLTREDNGTLSIVNKHTSILFTLNLSIILNEEHRGKLFTGSDWAWMRRWKEGMVIDGVSGGV